MSLATVRDGMAARLGSISGLRVYQTPPEVVQEFPAAVLTHSDPFVSFDQVMGAADVRYFFEVFLLVSSGDAAQALSDLEPYISPTGASSVKAAVDGDLDGNANWARVTQVISAGRVAYHHVSHWGAVFRVEVYETG